MRTGYANYDQLSSAVHNTPTPQSRLPPLKIDTSLKSPSVPYQQETPSVLPSAPYSYAVPSSSYAYDYYSVPYLSNMIGQIEEKLSKSDIQQYSLALETSRMYGEVAEAVRASKSATLDDAATLGLVNPSTSLIILLTIISFFRYLESRLVNMEKKADQNDQILNAIKNETIKINQVILSITNAIKALKQNIDDVSTKTQKIAQHVVEIEESSKRSMETTIMLKDEIQFMQQSHQESIANVQSLLNTSIVNSEDRLRGFFKSEIESLSVMQKELSNQLDKQNRRINESDNYIRLLEERLKDSDMKRDHDNKDILAMLSEIKAMIRANEERGFKSHESLNNRIWDLEKQFKSEHEKINWKFRELEAEERTMLVL
jgi:hypothetical protein